MKQVFCLLCALLLALPTFALAESPDAITVTYVASPLNIPSIVEQEKHIFEAHLQPLGVAVRYSELTTGPEQTQALASGDIQFLFAVGATSVILSAANGADIAILSMYSRSPEAFCLFAADDTLKTAEDLRGKTIVGPVGTILHELLVAYLTKAGMTIDDVNFVDMTIPNAVAALSGGSADAALIAGPAAYNMQAGGYPIVTTGKDLVDATIVVAGTRAYCDAHPEIVNAFLDAQRETLAFLTEHPEEAAAIAAKRLDLPLEAVAEMARKYDFSMRINPSDIAGMEKTMRFMLDSGMIDEAVDIAALIRP